MTALSIRPAKTSDIPAITRIYAHAVEHGTASFELSAPDEIEMARRMNELVSKDFPYLAAELGGALVGYAYAALYRTRPAYRWTLEDSVYIAPESQGHGIGRALLTRLIEESQARGFRQMIAVIGDSGQAASIALHRTCGFHDIGTLESVGFKFGRWLDTVLMQRALGKGSTAPP